MNQESLVPKSLPSQMCKCLSRTVCTRYIRKAFNFTIMSTTMTYIFGIISGMSLDPFLMNVSHFFTFSFSILILSFKLLV